MTTSYTSDKLRNVVLLGHGSSGKTSLAEAMLFDTGATNRLGTISEGTTVSDYDQDEIQRNISLNTTIIPCEWKKHKINFIDTPGYADFLGEVVCGVRVADAALILIDAVSAVEVGTEITWGEVDKLNLPRLVLVNKMDRENANYQTALAALRNRFEAKFIPLQLPLGEQADFSGVIDLLQMKAFTGEKGTAAEIPANLQSEAEEARMTIIEAAAEADDELIMKYLDGETLTDEEISRGLKAAVAANKFVPVLFASGGHNIGIPPLLDILLEVVPAPAASLKITNELNNKEEELKLDPSGPMAALVFKTINDQYGKVSYFRVYSGTLRSDSRVMNSRQNAEERIGQVFVPRGKEQMTIDQLAAGDIGGVVKLAATKTGDTLCDKNHLIALPGIKYPKPVYSLALAPKTQADSAKIGPGLNKLVEEDPSLHWNNDEATKQILLSGVGDSHLDISVKRVERKYGLGLETSRPKVPYRETVTKSASAQYRHKKQTGGAGQFGEVSLRVEPLPSGTGFEFTSEVFGGAISGPFIASTEKGVRQVLDIGVIAGYPVVDVKAIVFDGKEHPVDSKDIAFQIAGRESFKMAFKDAGPVLQEPICNLVITIPDEYTGDVMGDLNTKRARVMGMEQTKGHTIINAQAPFAELQTYATDLRSITQGRGLFTMEISHYDVVPSHLMADIIAQSQKAKEQKE
jgi:elongation factor G